MRCTCILLVASWLWLTRKTFRVHCIVVDDIDDDDGDDADVDDAMSVFSQARQSQ